MILLDLELGDGAGAALEFLAEAAADRLVVVLTGDRVSDRVEVARRGGRGFLARDRSPAETVDAVVALRERTRNVGTRVLAVDDDRLVLESIASLLGGAGLDVQICNDPTRFWEQLEAHRPDLVVLDYDMPKIEGPDLCRAMRNDARWELTPVLFLTARADPDSIRLIFEAGADNYVSKPFVGPALLGRISNRLERVRMMRTLAEVDPLTLLANRRRSAETLDSFCAMADRLEQPLCVAVMDVDNFKGVSDCGGHAVGDAVLRGIGLALARAFRSEDIASRWGGDEFVVGMYAMGIEDARERLGRFLEELREAPVAAGVHVTMRRDGRVPE